MGATARSIGVIGVVFVVALLTACGGDDNSSKAPPASTPALPTPAPPATAVANVAPTPSLDQAILTSAFARLKELPFALCPPAAAQSACVSLVNAPLSLRRPASLPSPS